jgi:acetylornithine/succinyldiaminopimelate/putrescine aminotransferase
MGAGIAVNVLGHAHPDLVQVLQKQAENLWHTSNLYNVSNQKKLADVLVEETFAQTVFFTNFGILLKGLNPNKRVDNRGSSLPLEVSMTE